MLEDQSAHHKLLERLLACQWELIAFIWVARPLKKKRTQRNIRQNKHKGETVKDCVHSTDQ